MSLLSAIHPPPELPIIIEEDHHHVLPHLYWLLRLIFRRTEKEKIRNNEDFGLPGDLSTPKFKLVHFDSHPDLSFPSKLSTSIIDNPFKLLNSLDDSLGGIAEWILPLCYKGHITEVQWYKQAFCDQIPDGEHLVRVGEVVGGRLRVDSGGLEYFKSDDIEVGEGDVLEKEQSFTLAVSSIDCDAQGCEEGAWVLDVCLDYFAVKNPFHDDVSSELRDVMHQMDAHDPKLVKEVIMNEWGDDGKETNVSTDPFMTDFRDRIKKELKGKEDRGAAMKTILDSWEMRSLPHQRVVTREAIDSEIAKWKTFVAQLLNTARNPPAMVTIARSAEDGFTPQEDVDYIQGEVVTFLQKKLPKGEVFADYETRGEKRKHET